MSTSASGPGNARTVSNTLGSLGGSSEYNDRGSFRERFGESLVTDRQKRLQAEREAQAILERIRFSKRHTAALLENIDRSVQLTGGQPLNAAAVPNVDDQFARKANALILKGPLKA